MSVDSTSQLIYLQSVKQFSEFVIRFNQDSYEIPELDQAYTRVLDRKQSIFMLFYRFDSRFDPNSPDYSESYGEKVVRFVEEIVNNGIYIEKHSDQIRAIATTQVMIQNRVDTLRIFLSQEVDEPNLVRWVIAGVDGGLIEIPDRDSTQLRFLSPVSHELGFMDLKNALKEPHAVLDYTRKDFEYDNLSVFLHGLFDGSIEFKEIISVAWEVQLLDKFVLSVGERAISESLLGIVIFDLNDL